MVRTVTRPPRFKEKENRLHYLMESHKVLERPMGLGLVLRPFLENAFCHTIQLVIDVSLSDAATLILF